MLGGVDLMFCYIQRCPAIFRSGKYASSIGHPELRSCFRLRMTPEFQQFLQWLFGIVRRAARGMEVSYWLYGSRLSQAREICDRHQSTSAGRGIVGLRGGRYCLSEFNQSNRKQKILSREYTEQQGQGVWYQFLALTGKGVCMSLENQ